MSTLDPDLRDRLDTLVRGDRVVLFMKGSPDAPRCGFSARVVELIDGHLDGAFTHVDVLAHPDVREGMKAYADWPTFPQLWVDGQLVGGADILQQLHDDGQLAELLGEPAPAPAPSLTLTPAARDRILGVLDGREPRLRLRIDGSFQYGFEEVDAPGPGDVVVEVGALTLVLDRTSARRADGMTMDYVSDELGAGLVVDNPNEPPRVQPLAPEQLAQWRADDPQGHRLIDVRTPEEIALAAIDGAEALDDALLASLLAGPRDVRLVFTCHHGMRSQAAAKHFLTEGFTRVFNLEGGIDAWSRAVDPTVPRY